MTTATNAFIQRDFYPLVGVTDTLVIVFQEHGPSAVRPRVVVTAADGQADITIESGLSADIDTFTLTEAISIPQHGSQIERALPITGAATTNIVSSLTVQRGKVSVTINSSVPFRSYLRQPLLNLPSALP
jgi:hypothetical protein